MNPSQPPARHVANMATRLSRAADRSEPAGMSPWDQRQGRRLEAGWKPMGKMGKSWENHGKPSENGGLPSGKRLHNYGKSHFSKEKSTINGILS